MKIDKMSTNDLRLAYRELRGALEKLRKSHDSLMPGLAHIAVQDYALVNESAILANQMLNKYQ